MGLQSQHRVPVNQKCREAAYSSRNHTTHPNNQPKGDDVQPKLVQVDLEMEKIPRCDEGTKVCPQCKYKAEHNGNDNHHIAHDPSCKESRFYKDFLENIAYSRKESIANNKDLERRRALRRELTKEEKFGQFGKGYNEDDVAEFFTPKKGAVPTYSGPPLPDSDSKPAAFDPYGVFKKISPATIIKAMNSRIDKTVQLSYGYKRSIKGDMPIQAAAVMDYLLDLFDVKSPTDSNELRANDDRSDAFRTLQEYKTLCPPGKMGITLPVMDKTLPPDPNEVVTLFLVRWELNIPGCTIECNK